MSRDRAWNVASGLLLATLLGTMLFTLEDYGVTLDEGVQNRYGRRLVQAYATAGEDARATSQNDLYLYGGFFELVEQLARPVSGLDVYESRHLVNALFGFVGYVAAWGLASLVGGPAAGFLAVLFLALAPEYYGQVFANPKDIPFASLYALAAWLALSASERVPRLGWKAILTTGLTIGLAAGVRVAGIALAPLTAALWLGALWTASPGAGVPAGRPGRRELARVGAASLAMLALGWTVMVAVWPWALLDPLRNPWRAWGRFAHFWSPEVLWKGELVPADALPRSYILEMLALKLPEVYFLALGLGAIGLLLVMRRGTLLEPAARRRVLQATWLALLPGLPLAWIVLDRTPLYHGCRHVLFVVPFLSVLAALGVVAFLRAGVPRLLGRSALATLATLALVTLVDMVQLHPYEYVHFNRLVAGGLARAAARYETDYYLAAYREGVEWAIRHYSKRGFARPVRMSAPRTHFPFWHYARDADPRRFRAVMPRSSPHVVFASPSYRDPMPAAGRVVRVVERQGAPLLYVLEVRAPR